MWLFGAIIIIILQHKCVTAVNCRYVRRLIDSRQWWTIFEIPKNFVLILW